MKGSILLEKFKPKSVYVIEDFDPKTKKPFSMVIMPLEEESFYLNQIGKNYTNNNWYDEKYFGLWEVTGECYIFEGRNHKQEANKLTSETRKELKGKNLIFQDDNLNLIKKMVA